MELLGPRLKSLRKGKNWTQRELAAKAGIEYSTLSGYERSTSYPSVPVLYKLCDILDVSSDYLLGKTDSMAALMSNLTDAQCAYLTGIILDLERLNLLCPPESE